MTVKSANFHITYGSLGGTRLALEARLEIEFCHPDQRNAFLEGKLGPKEIEIDDRIYAFKIASQHDAIAVFFLPFSKEGEIHPKVLEAVLDWLKTNHHYDVTSIETTEHFLQPGLDVVETLIGTEHTKPKRTDIPVTPEPKKPQTPLVATQPAPTEVPTPTPTPTKKVNNRLDVVKKYLSDFWQHPTTQQLRFHVRLFFKMPSQYPKTMGVLITCLTLAAGPYFFSFGWAGKISTAIFSGLIISACTIVRNRKYEAFAQENIDNWFDSDEQTEAYNEGVEAGNGWLPYLKSVASTTWIKEPLHYGAGLINTIDDIKRGEQNAREKAAFKRYIPTIH